MQKKPQIQLSLNYFFRYFFQLFFEFLIPVKEANSKHS